MSYQTTILNDTPLSYWPLREQSGTTATDVQGVQNGTYTGGYTLGATSLPSDSETGVTLDGSSGSVNLGSDASYTLPLYQNRSIELWVKSTYTAGTQVCWGIDSGGTGGPYFIGSISEGYAVNNGNKTLSVNICDGQWHHLVVTRTGAVPSTAYGIDTFYVDGVSVYVTSGSSAFVSGGTLRIGKFGDSLNFWWTGSIEKVAYYNYGLTSSQVTAHFEALSVTPESMTASPSSVALNTIVALTLTRTNGSAWTTGTPGSPTFSVTTPSSASIISQQITSSTTATVVVNTGLTTTGALTISDGTSSASTTISIPYTEADTTIGSDSVRVLVPTNYNSNSPTNAILYCHGSGQTAADLTDTIILGCINALTSSGYLVFATDGGGQFTWGSPVADTAFQSAITYIKSNWNINKIGILSASMGGLAGLYLVSTYRYPVWAGLFPVTNLAYEYANNSTFTGYINSAFNCDSSTYSTSTAGYDPQLFTPSSFSGIRMRFYASPADTIVPKANNADLMANNVSGFATENTVISTSGQHGDASNYQPADLLSFFNRGFIPSIFSSSSSSSSSSDNEPQLLIMSQNSASNIPPVVLLNGNGPGPISQVDQMIYKYNTVSLQTAPVTVELVTPYANSEIRYETNGSIPRSYSKLYNGPLVFNRNGSGSDRTVVQARIYSIKNSNVKGRIIRLEFNVI